LGSLGIFKDALDGHAHMVGSIQKIPNAEEQKSPTTQKQEKPSQAPLQA
jgi:hypothetical protein